MKVLTILTTSALSAGVLPGCTGQNDENRAQFYAITACEIPTDDKGEPSRDENGEVYFDPSLGSQVVNIDSDPIRDLQDQYDGWVKLATNAEAATRLDQSWSSLANSMTERAGLMSVWLNIRKEGQSPSRVDPNVVAAVNRANSLLAEWKSQCSGLATLLSE